MVNGEWDSRNLELALTNDITEIEAWDKDYQQHNIILTHKQHPIYELPIPINQWSVSPNPTSGEVVVEMVSKENKVVVFELMDAQGKILFTQNIEVVKGTNIFNLNLKSKTSLQSGLYFLKANGATQRLIVNAQ